MNKKPFVIFGLVLALLVLVIPFWAFMSDGNPEDGRMKVPAELKSGQELFQANCGNCHKLYAAGTLGNFGPDLDQLLAASGTPEGEGAEDAMEGTHGRVLSAIVNGFDTEEGPGRMPPGIVTGTVAEEISEFVAQTAGRG